MYPIVIFPSAEIKKTALNPVDDFIRSQGNEQSPPSRTDMNEYCHLLHGWLEFMQKTIPAQPYGTAVLFRKSRHIHAWAYNFLYPYRNRIRGFDAYEKALFDIYNSYADLSVDCSDADECLLAERQAIYIAVEAVKHCRYSMESCLPITDEILDYAIDLLGSIQHRSPEQSKALRDARLMANRYGELTVEERTSIMQSASVWLANSEYKNRGALMSSYWEYLCDQCVDDTSNDIDEASLRDYCNHVRESIYMETPSEVMTHETWLATGAEFCTELVEEAAQLAEDEQVCLGILARLNYKWATNAVSRVDNTFSGHIGTILETFSQKVQKLRKYPFTVTNAE